ncbi:MAG: dihydroneopterin aldolase [Bacteroidales bacterium]
MDIVSLEGMEFYAYHGCFAEEQKIGTYFLVDVALVTDVKQAARSDNLTDAIDYQKVYGLVKTEMQCPSHLLENVAERIAQSLLQYFTQMQEVRIKLAKRNPPIGGVVKQSSVSIIRKPESAFV